MRILVVEDDRHILQVITTILTGQNYAVESAIDGQTGWNFIDTFDYDLVLLDVQLPKLDGISLCRQIRAKGLSMPILLLTAQDNSHDKAIGLDAGADDYVVKPFDAEELVARIRALLRRGSTIAQPVLEWKQLRLDPTSCEVTYYAQPLSLTPKEYAMLELFLRNNRRVFSCGMILEHLWSYDEMPGEEAVRTHIKGLRQKLKSAGGADLIETVYGIGYRLKRNDVAEQQKAIDDKQATIEKISEVWQRFQGRVNQQVMGLERLAEVALRSSSDVELWIEAKRDAHSLAGALGMFGIPDGSKLAHQIESLLGETSVLSFDRASILQIHVQALRHEIERFSSTFQNTEESPLLLVIDRDSKLTDQLIRESINWKLRIEIATDLSMARKYFYHNHPSIVLFDPNTFNHNSDSLIFLSELHQFKPSVPILILTAQTDLAYRLELARQGRQTFLPKPASPTEILETISKILQKTSPPETKILIVDDDPKILAMLQSLLKPWGLNAATLDDSRQFWQTLEAIEPDLLILDVEMPHVNGIELCQMVRDDARWSELPILFLTAHTDAELINQAFAIGADDFVSKPIAITELTTRILNRLERKRVLQQRAKMHPIQTNINTSRPA
ncbi:MAG: response regulator [Leptolyngbyaceae cyanobacterium CSU_1_3]|nr:response regulator [Leptolyngbyaceae cyanobacterium CSU_1_3]